MWRSKGVSGGKITRAGFGAGLLPEGSGAGVGDFG